MHVKGSTATRSIAFVAVVGAAAVAVLASSSASDSASTTRAISADAKPPVWTLAPTGSAPAPAPEPAAAPVTAAAPPAVTTAKPPSARPTLVASPEGVHVVRPARGVTTLHDGFVLAAGAGAEMVVNVGSDGNDATVTRILITEARTERTELVRTVPGAWKEPTPVPGGSPEGISWDGSRVVLQGIDDPGIFIAVSTNSPAAQPLVIRPDGRFTYDALSTDGDTLFLTQYADPAGKQTYQIRAVDLKTGRLLEQPVVDKSDGGSSMAGEAAARATQSDFAYTVYAGGTRPFIHALSTGDGIYSLCIDLPIEANAASAQDPWSIAVSVDRRTVVAVNGKLGLAYAVHDADPQSVVTIPLAGHSSSAAPLAVESTSVAYVRTDAGVERIDLLAATSAVVTTPGPVDHLVATTDGVLLLGPGWQPQQLLRAT
jgi:hypothetical protein